jgi:DNA-binding NtrC family response regulator
MRPDRLTDGPPLASRRVSSPPGSLIAVVISTEPDTSAILREFLTHDGYQVRIEDDGQPLDVMLDHIRPRLVLVDVDHAEAFSIAFIEKARRAGAAVVAYSPSRHELEVRDIAAVYNLAAFAFPLRVSRFRDTLRAALAL